MNIWLRCGWENCMWMHKLHTPQSKSPRFFHLVFASLFFGLISINMAHSQCKLNSQTFPTGFFGNTNLFTLSNGSIISNIPASTVKQVAIAIQKCQMDSNTWLEATFSLEINPSSANYVEAYFHCDSSRQNGWIIRLGDTDDDIQLILLKKGAAQIILKGAKGYFNRTKSNITLRVVKQPEQIIVLYKDSAWEKFQCLGAGIDTMSYLQSYHGWGISQSGSSAAGKHKVEQWYIGPPRPDRTPPQLTNILWIQPNIARLQFSEPLQISEQQQFICNYNAADSIAAINSRIIIAKFPKVYCNQFNTVHCQNLLDTANNVSAHLQDSGIAECKTPIYFNQIIFTEIMVDPTPQVGYLPNAQYIEIYNTTDTAKWLHTLSLSDPQTSCALPKYLLPPKAFLVLHDTPDSAFNYLKKKAIRINDLPHFNIDGDEILLMYTRDTIHQLTYSDKWYHPFYKGGGYALEKTDLTCGCINDFNWHSNHDLGGTPGETNSTPLPWPSPRSVNAKSEPPKSRITEHRWRTKQMLEIKCNVSPERFDFSLRPAQPIPKLILIPNSGDTLNTTFVHNINNGWLFHIDSNEPVEAKAIIINAKDCAHRSLIDTQFQVFTSTYSPQLKELQFNEIMFNASDGSVDFIELVNTCDKAIQLQGLELLINNDQQLNQRTLLCPEQKTLYPNQIICFSSDPYPLAKTYNPERYTFHQYCSTFPNLSASGAGLQLALNNSPNIIDIMQYYESMHHSLLIETKGVSLEKNHPTAPSSSPPFWFSASSTIGFATPAESNSQQINLRTATIKNKKCFSLLNTVLGPNSRGNAENTNTLMLSFQMPQPGYILTAGIYNLHGGLMGVPIYQALIGKEGVLPIPIQMLNGTLSNGNYILHIDAFHREADICTQNLRWIYMNP